jgi:hypothetical protein
LDFFREPSAAPGAGAADGVTRRRFQSQRVKDRPTERATAST